MNKLKNASRIRIVIGASDVYETGWVGTEIEHLNLLKPSNWQTYFRKESIDAILAEHVWEHLSVNEGKNAAKLCFDYLKPGGYLRVAVPDAFHPDENYINYVKPGGTGLGSEDHKVMYNYISFSKIFTDAGFKVVLLEYFDTEGNFHFIDWQPGDGKITRSIRFDERNKGGKLNYTSLILDVCKELH